MAYITKEQTAKARATVNKIGKEYGLKFSTRMENYNTLRIALMQGREIKIDDLKLENWIKSYILKYGLDDNQENFIIKIKEFLGGACITEYYNLFNKYTGVRELVKYGYIDHIEFFKENTIFKKAFKEIEKEVKKVLGWYDRSDSMIDYFDTAFYLDFEVGKWDKGYKVTGGAK